MTDKEKLDELIAHIRLDLREEEDKDDRESLRLMLERMLDRRAELERK